MTGTKQSRGQAARLRNNIDLNLAFARAHLMFVQRFKRTPDWNKADTKLHITKESVVCEIREEEDEGLRDGNKV